MYIYVSVWVNVTHPCFSSLCEESTLGPTQLKPLLKQLVNLIFDPSKPELPDIELKTSGLGGLLKSGLG